MARPKTTTPRAKFASIRLTVEERAEMESAAVRHGFPSLSEYVRHLHELMSDADSSPAADEDLAALYPANLIRRFYKTSLGTMYQGDSLGYLFHTAPAQR